MATTYKSVVGIPTQQGVPFYTQRTSLEGRSYTLRFAWNARTGVWSLDLLDGDETPILLGLALVTNTPLLRAYHADARVPVGELLVACFQADKSPPGLDELGLDARCSLVYLSPNASAA